MDREVYLAKMIDPAASKYYQYTEYLLLSNDGIFCLTSDPLELGVLYKLRTSAENMPQALKFLQEMTDLCALKERLYRSSSLLKGMLTLQLEDALQTLAPHEHAEFAEGLEIKLPAGKIVQKKEKKPDKRLPIGYKVGVIYEPKLPEPCIVKPINSTEAPLSLSSAKREEYKKPEIKGPWTQSA